MEPEKINQALDMARCADHNMDNLAAWMPSVTRNPMFVVVMAQLRSVIDLLEGGDGELQIEDSLN